MNLALDIELIRTFQTVARLGKFSAAAAQLHKSPAAISAHIQRLEGVAGGRLLNRDNQAVSLTPLGQRLLSASAELLQAHDRVLTQLHGTHLAGRITLGVPDEYAPHVIRDILPVFSATWPNVVLEVKTAPSYTLRDLVARGKLQLAVMACLPGEPAPHAQVLTATTPVWVGAGALTTASDEPLPLAVYAADCPYRRAMLDTLRAQGRRWRVVLDTPSSQAVAACVESGLGISVIDRARVTPRMTVLEHLPALPAHEVLLVQAAATASDAATQLLVETLKRHFRL